MDDPLYKKVIELVGHDFYSCYILCETKWLQIDEIDQSRLKLVFEIFSRIRDTTASIMLKQVIKFKTTRCCPFQTIGDGRWQIKGKKCPHPLFVCKLFRWPDLNKMQELKQKEFCQYPFQRYNELVCLNPFHYDRDLEHDRLTITMGRLRKTHLDINGYDHSVHGNIWLSLYHYMDGHMNSQIIQTNKNLIYINGSVNTLYNDKTKKYSLYCEEFVRIKSKIRFKFDKFREGFSIINAKNGVFIKSWMPEEIFFQSYLINALNKFHPNTVIQIPMFGSEMIFNFEDFNSLVNEFAETGSYSKLESLSGYSKIIVSFFDSWGNTGARDIYEELDCYIEVILNNALITLANAMKFVQKPIITIEE